MVGMGLVLECNSHQAQPMTRKDRSGSPAIICHPCPLRALRYHGPNGLLVYFPLHLLLAFPLNCSFSLQLSTMRNRVCRLLQYNH